MKYFARRSRDLLGRRCVRCLFTRNILLPVLLKLSFGQIISTTAMNERVKKGYRSILTAEEKEH